MATPLLGDPNFSRTVVLMLEHDAEGSLGVVLNRPSPLPVDDPLPDWARFAADPPVVFVGGPVAKGSVIALARHSVDVTLPDGTWDHVIGRVGVLDIGVDADEVGPALDAVRVFTGYAGWGPEQLDGEIDEGAWFVVDAEAEDALTVIPDELWARVLRRQPPPLNRLALYPADPAVN